MLPGGFAFDDTIRLEMIMNDDFLPVTIEECYEREIWQPDFIVVSADAYVDHPSFGHALIARLIESQGFSVAVLPQPVTDEEFAALGEPKCAFLVSCGVVDSMVDNYTVAKRPRAEDVYSENGVKGRRPDRVATVYARTLKRLFPDSTVILGGIEASLRRFSHYDYWSDSVMRSVLYDSGADLLIYGMGENPIFDLCKAARKKIPLKKLRNVRGTAYLTDAAHAPAEVAAAIGGAHIDGVELLSSHERVKTDKKLYAKAFKVQYRNTDPFSGKTLVQKQDNAIYLVANPPQWPLTEKQMDFVYALPYARKPHPMYARVPAIEEVQFSVTAHRGCYGNCAFCALTYHQGRIVTPRSADSIVAEVERLAADPDFKGYISDIGGPSANLHRPACDKQFSSGVCVDRNCIGFEPCKNLQVDESEYLGILRRARKVNGVKKVFVRSGVRFDYALLDKDKTFLKELIAHHVSGQLKVAPEHVCDDVLAVMNKPRHKQYLAFVAEYERTNREMGKKQFLVPYLISSHPGCTLDDAVTLAEYLMSIRYCPEQVQDFYPTPGTLATTMYYTGIDPLSGKAVYVAKSPQEKAMQRALMQWRNPKNRRLIEEALRLTGRTLPGFKV